MLIEMFCSTSYYQVELMGNFITKKSMLSDTSACVKLNGMLTDWFPVSSGVRQGDSSSPTIFAFFINDLICGLNDLCCLAYADDV